MVKYDDEFFNNEINILRASAGIFSVTQHYTIFDYIYSNTLVPTSETKIHDDIIDIVKELNEKFRDDLKNFKNVGQRLSNMDNFLKDEAFLLSTELEAEKLDIEKISFFPSDDRTDEEKENEARKRWEESLPVIPTETVKLYEANNALFGVLESYTGITLDSEKTKELLDKYEPYLCAIDGNYYLYISSSDFSNFKECGKSFKSDLSDFIAPNLSGAYSLGFRTALLALNPMESGDYTYFDLSSLSSFGIDLGAIVPSLTEVTYPEVGGEDND